VRSQAWLPLVATLVSLEFALALARRWWATRRPYLRSWSVSLLLFAGGSAALWYGTAFGWSTATFRTYYACGAVLSVPWLALGEVELLLRPRAARVVAVFVALLSVNAAFLVATAPGVAGVSIAGTALPSGSDYFPAGVHVLAVVANSVGTLVVVGGTLWSGRRSRRAGQAARARFRATLLIVAGVLVVAGSSRLTFLGKTDALAVCLATGAGLMYVGFLAAARRPGAHRAQRRRQRAEAREGTYAPGELGDGPAVPAAVEGQPTVAPG
jgi:hypothetical protein